MPASSSENGPVKKSPAPLNPTCDLCRKRKIKCVNDPAGIGGSSKCEGCRKLDVDCLYLYVRQKPGRKSQYAAGGVGKATATQASISLVELQNTYPYPPVSSLSTLRTPTASVTQLVDSQASSHRPFSLENESNHTSGLLDPVASTSAQPYGLDTLTKPSAGPLGASQEGDNDFGYSWLDSILEGNADWLSTDPASQNGQGLPDSFFEEFEFLTQQQPKANDQIQLLAQESPEFGSARSLPETTPPVAALATKIERKTDKGPSWDHITHFVSLWLQYLYPLLPLVHRPRFAEDLAMRRDLRDPDFKALLLSIVAYVISQLPTTRLVNEQYSIEGLKSMQRSCHRVSRTLQRSYYGTPNLTQITTIIFDSFYLLSVGLDHSAGTRLGQAFQLAYSCGLHSDAKTDALGLNAIEVQLRRRVFWQLFAADKTRAIGGLPMLLCEFQGTCSLPEPIDDEFITSQGYFTQPKDRISHIVGFIAVTRVFRLLYEVFFHHRCILSGTGSVTLEWVAATESRLHLILAELPPAIQEPMNVLGEDNRRIYAMQRANILVTTAIVKFALYDLKASLHADEAILKREKETVAREMHSLLMHVSIDDIASNGESARGKVFHIINALCVQLPANDLNFELVRDWYNMFLAISFIQMPVPAPGTAGLESRAPSPPMQVQEAAQDTM